MVVAFTRIFFFRLLLTFTLTMRCWALEGDNQIRVSFSIWSPPSMDLDLVDEAVSGAMRSFFCEDISFILLDTNFRSVCHRRALGRESNVFSNIARIPMLEFIKQTDPVRSYLADESTHVLISDSYDVNGTIQRTTWDVNYEVLQIGSNEIEKARMANITDEMVYMEDRIQLGLNASITDGIMNQKLRGTGIIMGVLGQEWQTFPESSVTLEEDNINVDPELDYEQSAIVLRYIGIVMLIGSFACGTILPYLGRRYRLELERKELAARDPENQRGLVTEQGVNLMLEIGRRESERMSSNTST